jgi:hypothetical protein
MELSRVRAGEPLAVPRPVVVDRYPALTMARKTGSLALRATRWAVLGLVRREPAPILTLGFGAGLVARAALASLATRQQTLAPRQQTLAPLPTGTDVVGIEIETIVVRTTRLLRRA